jgi:hypothetical protein
MAANRPRTSTSALEIPSESKKKILRIGIVQNGRIVEERLLKQRGHISIGRGADNTFLIPSKDLPKYFKVFEEAKDNYILNFVKGMDARLAIDGKIFTLNQIIERGEWVKKVGPYHRLDLTKCSRGKLVIGEVTILFHFVTPPPELPKPQLPHVMWGLYAIKQWLGMVFMGVTAVSLAGAIAFIFLMHSLYDPNWKPSDEAAKKIISRAIKRHVKVVEKKIEPSDSKKVKAGAGEDDKAKAKVVAIPKVSAKKVEVDTTPATKANIENKVAKIGKEIGKLKIDSKALGNIKNLKLGSIPDVGKIGMPNVGDIKIANGSVGVNTGDVGTTVTEDSVGATCTGATCTVATHGQFKPGQHTSDNEYGVTGSGGGGGKGGPKGAKLPTGLSKIKINVNIANTKIKIPSTKIGKIDIKIGKIKIPTLTMTAPKKIKPPKVSASASGLIPGGAPLGIRKIMGSVKYRVIRCFRQAATKGMISNGRKTVTVSCKITGGNFSVTGVSGISASLFTGCVKRVRKSVKSTDAEGKKFSKSWKFTMHMIAKASE